MPNSFAAALRKLLALDGPYRGHQVTLKPLREDHLPQLDTWGWPRTFVQQGLLASRNGGLAFLVIARWRLMALVYAVRDGDDGRLVSELAILVSKEHQRRRVGLHAGRKLLRECKRAGFLHARAKARAGSGGAALAGALGMRVVRSEGQDEFFEMDLLKE